jgi:hypothetical protein
MSASSHQNYLHRISRIHKPPVTTTFHFHHTDLGPTNVLISDNNKIKAMLDWESAGFYPKYWVTLNPYMSLGFCLPATNNHCAWADLLITKLVKRGFVLDMGCIEWHKDLDQGYFDTDILWDG